MPLVLPTIEQIEDYLESVEELVVSSLSAATPDLPKVSEAINRLWQDVLRHSPQAVPASLKGLGAFEVPPPPPPPPPPPVSSVSPPPAVRMVTISASGRGRIYPRKG